MHANKCINGMNYQTLFLNSPYEFVYYIIYIVSLQEFTHL